MRLTEAQTNGLQCLAGIPPEGRIKRTIGSPRTNTLVALSDFGLAAWSTQTQRYEITDEGRRVLTYVSGGRWSV